MKLPDERFRWNDAKAASNFRKHRVRFEEAIEALLDPLAISEYDEEHSGHEERWKTIGLSNRSRILFVVTADVDDNEVRIISARKATRDEQAIYENQPRD